MRHKSALSKNYYVTKHWCSPKSPVACKTPIKLHCLILEFQEYCSQQTKCKINNKLIFLTVFPLTIP